MKDIHGGNIWAVARKYGLKVDEIADFSASINPLIPHEDIRRIILTNIESIFHYPDPEYKVLTGDIARILHIGHENILIGNGSIEFIYLIPRVLKTRKVLIPVPAFTEYEKSVLQSGAIPQFVYGTEESCFKISVEDLINSLEDIDMVFLCNPNNPTGLGFDRNELHEFIDVCDKRGIWIVVDEAFIEFLADGEDVTHIYEALRKKRVMVLRSFTKSFSIPGLRLGYLIGNQETVKILKEAKEPWSVNSLAQAMGSEIIKDLDYIKRVKEYIKVEREFLFSELGKVNSIKLFPSRVNFILASLKNPCISSKTLADKLAAKGILIRELSSMRGLDNRFFRFAVRTHAENERLLKGLEEVLSTGAY